MHRANDFRSKTVIVEVYLLWQENVFPVVIVELDALYRDAFGSE